MIEPLNKLLNELSENTKKIGAWFLILVSVIVILAVLLVFAPKFRSPPKASPPRPTFKKADYSSDRSWLECRDHQLICLYGGLWDELSSKEILEICGQHEVCDDIFGSGIKVGGKK
jgi:hypothetical protein